MADTKISALTDGGVAQAADEIPVARAGGNNKLSGDDFVAVLARQASVTITNTTTETTIATATVPGGELGTTRLVKWEIGGSYLNNNLTADVATLRVKFGGTTIYQDNVAASAISASRRAFNLVAVLKAAGATGAQNFFGLFMLGAVGATTGIGDIDVDEIESAGVIANDTVSIDDTAAQTFEITWQWGQASANNSLISHGGVLTRL